MHGNTSINPFFYGTYLAETKPNEPVTRTKKQAFQADAVGVVHQLTHSHFLRPHTFRVEWQPGRGGQLDWYVKAYRGANDTDWIDGDGNGDEWAHVFSLKDKVLDDLMGSQIPIEPSYLIMNIAVSSTWGFPYDVPEWCNKCYDCNDPRCACSFYPGFCPMLASRKTAMYIDSVRVYQSRDDSAHMGAPHTLGCDPPDYPTKEWIEGHSYRYMRNPPFSYEDTHPIRKIQRGGGSCKTDSDCGANVQTENLTATYEAMATGRRTTARSDNDDKPKGRGRCTEGLQGGMFSMVLGGHVCSCNTGFTGPHCLSIDHIDDTPSAHLLNQRESPFRTVSSFAVPGFMLYAIVVMSAFLLSFLVSRVLEEKRTRRVKEQMVQAKPQSPIETLIRTDATMITGTSI